MCGDVRSEARLTVLVVVDVARDGEQLRAALQRVLQVVRHRLVVVQHLLLRALQLVYHLVEREHLRRHVALLHHITITHCIQNTQITAFT